jgi:hypothetical protein
MNTSLMLYALGGAISFCILSMAATKYRGDQIQAKHIVRDTTAGGIFTALIIALVPDMLPPISLPETISTVGEQVQKSVRFDDYELQIGYPKKK